MLSLIPPCSTHSCSTQFLTSEAGPALDMKATGWSHALCGSHRKEGAPTPRSDLRTARVDRCSRYVAFGQHLQLMEQPDIAATALPEMLAAPSPTSRTSPASPSAAPPQLSPPPVEFVVRDKTTGKAIGTFGSREAAQAARPVCLCVWGGGVWCRV